MSTSTETSTDTSTTSTSALRAPLGAPTLAPVEPERMAAALALVASLRALDDAFLAYNTAARAAGVGSRYAGDDRDVLRNLDDREGDERLLVGADEAMARLLLAERKPSLLGGSDEYAWQAFTDEVGDDLARVGLLGRDPDDYTAQVLHFTVERADGKLVDPAVLDVLRDPEAPATFTGPRGGTFDLLSTTTVGLGGFPQAWRIPADGPSVALHVEYEWDAEHGASEPEDVLPAAFESLGEALALVAERGGPVLRARREVILTDADLPSRCSLSVDGKPATLTVR